MLTKKYKVLLCGIIVIVLCMVLGVAAATAQTTEETKAESGDDQKTTVPVTEVEVKADKEKAKTKRQSDEAAKEPEYSHLALPESTSAVQVFTVKDIEVMHPNDVVDVIEFAMGMDIQRQGARIHTFTYGRGGDNIPIILDGVYITNDSARRVLGDLPVDMIESIKVVRDSTALTLAALGGFGSTSGGASGQGAIIITTKQAKDHENEANLDYGSYNTLKLSAFSGMKFKNKFHLGVGYAKSKSDGKDGWNNGDDFDSILLNGKYQDEKWVLATSLFSNEGWREIQRAFDSHAVASKGFNTTNIAMWKYDPMDTLFYTLNLARLWNANQVTALSYGYSQVEGTQYAYTYNATTGVLNTSAAGKGMDNRSNELNLSHTMHLGHNTLKVGTQMIRSYQLGEGSVADGAQKEEMYGYYITETNHINDGLNVDAGFRLDRRHITQGGEKYESDGGIAKIADDMWTDNTYGFSVGAEYWLNKVYSLLPRFAYNHTPTPEMWTTKNGEELPAEERFKYEVGVAAGYSRAFNITLTAFCYDIKNGKTASGAISVKDEDGADQSVSLYSTVSAIQRSGLETAFEGKLSERFGYKLGYTYFTSSEASEDLKFPDHKYSAQLNYQLKSWDVGIASLWVDPYLSNSYEVGGFNVINVGVAKKVNATTKISIYGRNVTNEHYATNYKGTPQEWGYLHDVGAVYGIALNKNF
jgi:hypothetical protein